MIPKAMSQKLYAVQFEIAGPAAMFTRPDTGSAFTSYPVPTYSAAKGMFEAIARIKTAYIRPTKVEVCCPIRYHKYVTNYGGPLRKVKSVKKNESYQLMALILVDVCYRVYGVIEECGAPSKDTHGNPLNHRHLLQDKFETRLRNGRFYYVPCLGWKEFVPSYMGPFRLDTKVNSKVNETIPSMLYSVFDKPVNGERNPEFRYNLKIKNGVFEYDQRD